MKTKNLLVVPALIAVLNLIPAGRVTAQITITVTSTADSGAGTLRAALASAANGDTIDVSGVTGTILLTSGELLVTNSVTILGPGPANLAVNGNAVSRVFHIALSNTVTIASLTITNGKTSGGYPTSSGGGIYNYHSTLTVSNCTLSSNSASGSGGGIYNDGDTTGSATLTVSASTLTNNSAQYGGSIYNDAYKGSATLTVSTSTLGGNSAQYGGGIYNNGESSGTGTVQIANSILDGNSAGGSGGGIYNDGKSSGKAALTVSTSTLSGNWAGSGSGIYNDGSSFGKATLTMSSSTFSGNSANITGGIYNNGESSGTGTVQIANSTLSGNSASYGAGIYNDGYNGSATLTVSSSTFSGNSTSHPGGSIYNNGSASVEIGSTILKAFAPGSTIANASGTVSSDGYNLSSDAGGGVLTSATDQINTDPMLGPLQDNGGPSFTHALLPGSPAIDKGTNFSGYPTDQRGFPRTVDGLCIPNAPDGDSSDIGAFEVQQLCPVAVSLGNVGVLSNQLGFDIAGGSNQVVVVEASTDLVSWTALATNTLGAGPLHFSDPGWTNFQRRFYRAKLAP